MANDNNKSALHELTPPHMKQKTAEKQPEATKPAPPQAAPAEKKAGS